jgi:hypothetical protein
MEITAYKLVTAIVTASSALVVAVATYWFTKKREREAELRKEKLEHYKEFVASLSGILTNEGTPLGQRLFAKASNNLNLVAPQAVIVALQEFQRQSRASNPQRDLAAHDRALTRLFYEIRRDLGISPNDNESTFSVGLWAAGVPPEA